MIVKNIVIDNRPDGLKIQVGDVPMFKDKVEKKVSEIIDIVIEELIENKKTQKMITKELEKWKLK